MLEILFNIGLCILVYTYLGYGILLYLLVKVKRVLKKTSPLYYQPDELPNITIVIACYNEEDFIEKKITNCLSLDYPNSKRTFVFVTDGSSDRTNEIIKKYDEVSLSYQPERKGKNAAINRVMPDIKTHIVVFCDANTILNSDALQLIARHYKDPDVGAVAGEKRVAATVGNAAGSGESAYWKYESKLKEWDSELNTVVGAAGELISIRTEFYEQVPEHVIIEDFRLSMNIAKKGYKVVYEPAAYAVETSSESIEEEQKRKVRISAGGLIEVAYFVSLLNFFKYGLLSFQYVSHRMLRWTLAPLSLPLVLITNLLLVIYGGSLTYQILLVCQLLFYGLAIIGYLLRNADLKFTLTFVPYYFLFMNLSVYQGLARLIKGKQSAVWEKAKRA